MLIDKFWEACISFYIDATGFQHKYNPHDETQSIRTMAWQLKTKAYILTTLLKDLTWAREEELHISLWQQHIKKVLFNVNSMKAKLMETCSQISSKHTFKKLSVDAGFQKANDFFKTDVLHKTVKGQDKLWIHLEQSKLAYFLVHQI